MKLFAVVVLLVAIAGCAQVAKQEKAARARDAAMDAAARRMIVTRGTNVPGHPTYAPLGTVQGYCRDNPEADDIVAEGDNLREAAYRRYGDRVDAIVGAHAWFVPNVNFTQQVADPQVNPGHFECAGTAVHFGEAAK